MTEDEDMDVLKNIDVYIQRMERSLADKLFFLERITDPIQNILDFGCANGVLIQALKQACPEYSYVGYDISEEMVQLARAALPDCKICREWDEIDLDAAKTLINVSSTVHEVYAYGTKESVSEFWDRVFSSGFQYIAIRDMMLSERSLTKTDARDVEKIRGLYPAKLAEYENIWGSVEEKRNFIHYLLKYRYTENWEREVNENYLPITVEEMLSLIPPTYEIVYMDHYVLPFIRQCIKEDSGIILEDATHIKLLLKRK
jgi:ribosomal protein L11 methylase PrmA